MTVYYKKRFQKSFKKLPPLPRDKFKERLRLFRQNKFDPLLHNHSVDAAYPGCRSTNVTGDYRALFKEKGDDIVFVMIGTHPELYR